MIKIRGWADVESMWLLCSNSKRDYGPSRWCRAKLQEVSPTPSKCRELVWQQPHVILAPEIVAM